MDFLKKMFPKPQLPQKRYMLIVLIIFGIIKIYTTLTPDPSDDNYAEKFRDTALLLVKDDGSVDILEHPDAS